MNFLDKEVDSLVIVIYKSIVIFAILMVIYKVKSKFDEFKCAMVLLLSSAVAAFLDSVCWGYTLDYFYFNQLTCYDLKDFYVDTAIALLLMTYIQKQ